MGAQVTVPAMLLAWMMACTGGPPEALSDCDDVECRVAWSKERWTDDRAAVLAGVAGLEPVEQAIVVQALTEAFPGDSREACDVLPQDDPAWRRCDALNARPHLWQIDREDPEAGPAGSGKLYRSLALSEAPRNPWEGVEGHEAPCEDEQLRTTCQSEAGISYAAQGRARDAGLACQAIAEAQWREECFFQVADAATRAERRHSPEIVELCMGAGDYVSRCLGHLATNLADRAPSALSPDGEHWAELARSIETAARALQSYAPELPGRFADRTWSSALGRSYATVSSITGAPVGWVPPEAHPHLRAAIAWRLWELEGEVPRDLDAWVVRFDQVATDRTTSQEPGLPSDELVPRSGYWDEDLEGEEAIRWVNWFADTRRAASGEPGTDWIICLLEAAARSPQHAVALFDEASRHPDREVRWTAARLAPMVSLNRTTLARMAGDSDPLVAQRGALAQRRSGLAQ